MFTRPCMLLLGIPTMMRSSPTTAFQRAPSAFVHSSVPFHSLAPLTSASSPTVRFPPTPPTPAHQMGGVTKSATVFTSAGCCAKLQQSAESGALDAESWNHHLSDFGDHAHTERTQKERWSQIKRTKGSVSLSFTLPISGVPVRGARETWLWARARARVCVCVWICT